MEHYPAAMYRAGESCLVENEAQRRLKTADGWTSSPDGVTTPAPEPAPVPEPSPPEPAPVPELEPVTKKTVKKDGRHG